MVAQQDVYHYAKSFFGFNNNMRITIIVPRVKQTRIISLRCKNYPLFDYEISPDDAYSTFRILELLTTIDQNQNPFIINVAGDFDRENSNNIFIGGPPTNRYVHALTENGPLKFGKNNKQRDIHGLSDIYWIEFEEFEYERTNPNLQNTLSIVKDYCLISKNTNGNHVEFVVGGLRAYGQRAAYDFLNDINFYRAIKDLFDYPFFRILVRVSVCDKTIVKTWKIVEKIGSNSEDEWRVKGKKLDIQKQLNIFLSYVSDDWDTKVHFLEKRLRQEYFDVFIAKRNIPTSRNWEEAIKEEITHTDVVLVCFSENYLKRHQTYVDKEIEIALKLKKFIIPIRFEHCPIHFPALGKMNWSDLFGDWEKKMSDWTMEDWTREKNLRKLIKELYKKKLKKIRNE